MTVRDRGERLCAITSFTVDGVDPEDVKARLRGEGCNVSVSTATSAQLDLAHRGLDSVVRASLHYVTTDDELDRFATLLHEIVDADARWRAQASTEPVRSACGRAS